MERMILARQRKQRSQQSLAEENAGTSSQWSMPEDWERPSSTPAADANGEDGPTEAWSLLNIFFSSTFMEAYV